MNRIARMRKEKTNNESMGRTKHFKAFFMPKWLVFSLCSVLALILAGAGVYAWFTGAYNINGTRVTTGVININFRSYKAVTDETGAITNLLRYVDVSTENPTSVEFNEAMQKDVGILTEKNKSDDIYFIVERNADCIPLDIRLAFHLVGLKENSEYIVGNDYTITYAGGFYYRLQEVTNGVVSLLNSGTPISELLYHDAAGNIETSSTVTPIEQALYSYMASTGTNTGETRELLYIEDVNTENETHTLRDSKYCVYRLTIGVKDDAAESVLYSNASFNVEVALLTAQEDGFQSHGTTKTHHVANESQLRYALDNYAPGDSIVFDEHITYHGDLVLTKPVNLYLNYNGGHTLTVNGNFHISYGYNDTFLINTYEGGQIKVLKYGNAGGNFLVDLPKGNLILQGAGNKTVGMADYYVQDEIVMNASCIPLEIYDSGTTGYGVAMESVRILYGTGASDENQVLHQIFLKDDTQLTIYEGTTVGQIKPYVTETNVERLVIVNHSTLSEAIDLTQMSEDYSGRYNTVGHAPQIFIDNYGILQQSIKLPSWSVKFNTRTFTGNTRIIREVGGSDYGVAAGSLFASGDIEILQLTQNVVDVMRDGTELLVYYFDTTPGDGVAATLESILSDHMEHYTEEAGDNFNTNNLNQIKKLTIVTMETNYLSDADYTYLRKMTALEELDISDCITGTGSNVNKIPNSAFSGMTSLWSVKLPNETVSLGNTVFTNTKVLDLYLPSKLSTLTSSSLNGVRGVHIAYTGAVIKSNLSPSSTRYVFLPDADMLSLYRTQYSGSKPYLFREATWLRNTDIYYRLVSNTDAEFAAYVGSAYNKDDTTLAGINLETIAVNGEDYFICSIDDYAFYNKILPSEARPTYTFTLSPRLTHIGDYAFYQCTAIVGDIDLRQTEEIGVSTFQNCTGIRVMRGEYVTKISSSGFNGCSSMLVAYCPRAALSSNTFANCTNLAILESAINSGIPNLFAGNKGLRLWILHPEYSSETTFGGNDYYTTDGINANCLNGASRSYRILVSANKDNTPGIDYYQKMKGIQMKFFFTTDQYLGKDYVYLSADPNNKNLVRHNMGTAADPVYYNDLAYGDYVYGIDRENHTASLLCCLLEEINEDYVVPDSIIYEEEVYDVIAVGAHPYIDFHNHSVTLGANVKTVYEKAWYGVTTISGLDVVNAETIQEYAFNGCSGILGNLDLKSVTTLGSNAFQNCTGLTAAAAKYVTLVSTSCFSGCSSIRTALFPNAMMNGNAFNGCSSLYILETSVHTNDNNGAQYMSIAGCTGLCTWIMHTENSLVTSIGFSTYNWSGSAYGMAGSQPKDVRVLISTNSENSLTGINYNSLISVGGKISTQKYTADHFFWFSESATNTNVTKHAWTDEEGNKTYLSDYGCGDYICAYDPETGDCAIIACLLDGIGGTYSLPDRVTDREDRERRINDITEKAFYYTPIADNTATIFPPRLSSVGNSAFYNKTGIVTALKFSNQPGTIGPSAFYGCSGLTSVEGEAVTSIDTYAFYGCSNIVYARFPKCSINGTMNYIFAECGELRTLETSVCSKSGNGDSQSNAMLRNDDKFLVWILHTENATLTSIVGSTYGSSGTYSRTLFPSVNGETYTHTIPNFRIIVSTNAENPAEKDYYSTISGQNSANTISSFEYTADHYFYVSASSDDPTVKRRNIGTEEEPMYLSDIGYGDYIYAFNPETGKTSLVYCLLEEIKGDFVMPDSVMDADGVSHEINEIGHRAFYDVTFVPGATMVLPSKLNGRLGDEAFYKRAGLSGNLDLSGLTSVGTKAFYGCTTLRAIKGTAVASINTYAFYGCSSLLTACFPKGVMNKTMNYTFAECGELRILETAVCTKDGSNGDSQTNAMLRNDDKFALWIIHTENSTLTSIMSNTYGTSGTYKRTLFPSENGETYTHTIPTFRILVSSSTANPAGLNYYSTISGQNSYASSLWEYTPDQFFYVSAEDGDLTVKRRNLGTEDAPVYYSDVNYGDYIYAYNPNTGLTSLVYSLLEETDGNFVLPDTVMDEKGNVRTVNEIGTRAFNMVTFKPGTTIKLPNINGRIGDEAFRDCTGLSKEVNLNGATSLGTGAFRGCVSLRSLCGDKVKSIGNYATYGCSEIVAIYLPQGEMNGTMQYTFAECPKLRVLETSVASKSGSQNSDTNGALHHDDSLVLWVVHSENASISSFVTYSFVRSDYNLRGLYQTNNSTYDRTFPDFKILVSASTVNPTGKNYYSLISGQNTTSNVISTDKYNQYFWVSEPADNSNVTRSNFGTELDPVYYSDMGGGDYLCGYDPETGDTIILFSLLDSVQGTYQIPDTLDVPDVGVTYTNDIGTRLYNYTVVKDNTYVSFPSHTKRIFSYALYNKGGFVGDVDLHTANSIATYAFYGCSGLRSIKGSEVLTINDYSFYHCSNLLTACFPKGVMNQTMFYAFAECGQLRILETAVATRKNNDWDGWDAVLTHDDNLVLWILHTENSNLASIYSGTYGRSAWNQRALFAQNGDTPYDHAFPDFKILVSSSTVNPAGKNYYSLISAQNSSDIVSADKYTGQYYFWENESSDNPNVTRANFGSADSPVYYSDLFCGDYLCGYDPTTGETILLYSFLDSVQGDYAIPATLTVPDVGEKATNDIGGHAYHHTVVAEQTGLLFPTTTGRILNSAFRGKSGFIGDINLYTGSEVQDYAFYGCSGMVSIKGTEVNSIGNYAFYGCTNLRVATLPKGVINQTMNYTFAECPDLRVLETSIATKKGGSSDSTNGMLTHDDKLAVWIVHTENGSLSAIASNSFTVQPVYQSRSLFYVVNDYSPYDGNHPFFNILVSANTNNPAGKNYYSLASGSNDSRYENAVTSTGNFTADQYRYADETENPDVVRICWEDDDGVTRYLSDYGYGDYVYAVDADGNATLLCSLLQEVNNDYATPDTFPYEDEAGVPQNATVISIGARSYKWTAFNNQKVLTVSEGVTSVGSEAFSKRYYGTTRMVAKDYATVILPSTLASIGDNCFYQAPYLTHLEILNKTTLITATDIYGSTSFPQGFHVYVSKYAYEKIYPATWAKISKATYFLFFDYQYQPVEGGPIFYLVEFEDGYQITYVADTPTADTVLTFPDDYYVGGEYKGNVLKIMDSAMATVQTHAKLTKIVLPKYLKDFDSIRMLLPQHLTEFEIDPANEYFDTLDGVLYSQNLATLLIYPAEKPDTSFTIPHDVYAIALNAFKNVKYLQTISDTPETSFNGYLFIPTGAFVNCSKLSSVTFGKSVALADNAFNSQCPLNHVYFLGLRETQFLGLDPFNGRGVTKHFGTT